jgi:hypothetical protein
MSLHPFFFQHTFDKKELQRFLAWSVQVHGRAQATHLADRVKAVGFHYATDAGLSLGLEDLSLPSIKSKYISTASTQVFITELNYKRGEITSVERLRAILETWAWTSEIIKKQIIYSLRDVGIMNPLSMMAFSGARGNISQVRQLVGIRGLMSDPQGDLLDFPIQSNFKEGLSVLEYIISCYGARKGLVDTALRTANSGYLTRRLVEVAQSLSISTFDCTRDEKGTNQDKKVPGFPLRNIDGNEGVPLHQRLIGRVLSTTLHPIYAKTNQDITPLLAKTLVRHRQWVFVRSILGCTLKKSENFCQLCYGWDSSRADLVSLGEAVGIVAAQSIGEPGTQLTMRTFHTGGVFSGNVGDRVIAPHNGKLYIACSKLKPISSKNIESYGYSTRMHTGRVAFLTTKEVTLAIIGKLASFYKLPKRSCILVAPGSNIQASTVLVDIPAQPRSIVRETEKATPTTSRNSLQSSELAQDDTKFEVSSLNSGQIYFEDVKIVYGPTKFQTTNAIPLMRSLGFSTLWVVQGLVAKSFYRFQAGDLGVASSSWLPDTIDKFLRMGTISQKKVDKRAARYEDEVKKTHKDHVCEIRSYEHDKEPKGLAFVVTHTHQNVYLSSQTPKLGSSQYVGNLIEQSKTNEGIDKNQNRWKTTQWVTQVKMPLSDDSSQVTVRKVHPYGIAQGAKVHVLNSQLIEPGQTICTLRSAQKKTGDIVQGLPKIDQFFEARRKKSIQRIIGHPKELILTWFFYFRQKGIGFSNAQKLSRLCIQKYLVQSLQRVYMSQGVFVSEKHLECIVYQMTRFNCIYLAGTTPLLPGEIFPWKFISLMNNVHSNNSKALSIPWVLGLRQLGLVSTSFLRAASFQETRRVLVQSALEASVDRMQEVKQRVMVGRLLPLGTTSRYVRHAYYRYILNGLG